jgi:hypothetical protein
VKHCVGVCAGREHLALQIILKKLPDYRSITAVSDLREKGVLSQNAFNGRSNGSLLGNSTINYENYQCRIHKKRGLAATISAGDNAGDSFCRAFQRRQIIFDQYACRA